MRIVQGKKKLNRKSSNDFVWGSLVGKPQWECTQSFAHHMEHKAYMAPIWTLVFERVCQLGDVGVAKVLWIRIP